MKNINVKSWLTKFIMKNLEIFALCFALQFWFDAGCSWKYWATVLLVAISSGISINWQEKQDKNKTESNNES